MTYWWLLILAPTAGGVGGYIYSQSQDQIYEATATILVQYRGSLSAPGFGDFQRSQELASTYRRLVTAKPFLEFARENRGETFGEVNLKAVVSASTASNPPALEIEVRQRDPRLAAITAQAVAEEFIDYAIEQRLVEFDKLRAATAEHGIVNGEDILAAQLATIDSLSLLEPVEPPGSPVVPRTRLNIAVGVIVGLIPAIIAAILLDSMRDTVRFPDELSRRFGVTNLGAIFRWSSKEAQDNRLILLTAPRSSYAEAFRQTRANLQFATASRPGKILMVGSPGPAEGKTTVISNLAVALAHAGKRVVTIDGDMRKPAVHKLFAPIQREPGLSNYLSDLDKEVWEVIRPTRQGGVHVIPSGPSPPNPAELLGSPRMSDLLNQLVEEYDSVLVDSPPVLLVADASIMATQVDGVIVVVDAFSTRSSSLRATLDVFHSAHVDVLGVVVNKLKPPRLGLGYLYPYHNYSKHSYDAETDQANGDGNGRIYRHFFGRATTALARFRRNGHSNGQEA